MPVAHEPAKKARRGRPVPYSLGALIAVLVAAFGLWRHSLDVTPAIAIPTPERPRSRGCGMDRTGMGEQSLRGASILGWFTSEAAEANGRTVAWGALDHLSAREARDAASRLDTVLQDHTPYADTLREEKWMVE